MSTRSTLQKLQTELRARLARAARERFGIALDDVAIEVPPRVALGDLAFPVAFELARRIKQATGEKRAPRQIAEELRPALEDVASVRRVEVAGAGYLNVFFDRAALLATLSAETPFSERTEADDRPKRIVEHTNINPNKAAHIGHLRNAVLGDAFVRILRAAGERVEVQNYIDNTGVQVADTVVGFIHLERMTLPDVRALDQSLPPDRPFDYYCWDLYARVGLFYRNGDPDAPEDADKLRLRAEVLHAIEAGGNDVAELAEYVSMRIVECHLKTMQRLGIEYDVLPRESEILHLRFWERAFERLKQAGVVRYETEGRNAGCWIMPTDLHKGTEEHEADKILVRSNGTVTYAGKDIAYQLWKLGLLGLDFYYKPFHTYPNGHIAWVTTSDAREHDPSAPKFGGGATVYNVIDARQSYTQEVVRRAVAALAPEAGERASIHLAYEMVALSPAACAELGIELSDEDRARPFIEMSGRKGLGVKADDLINRLEANAQREVEARHADLAEEEKLKAAHQIAVGALRYFLLKWTRNSVIAFDFKEALSFDGETGPYCQYAAVRAGSIFRKLDAGKRARAEELVRRAAEDEQAAEALRCVFDGEAGDELWALVTLAARLEETTAQAAAMEEPAHLAKYAFQLAKTFNLFYHRHRIISEEDETRQAALIAIAELARNRLGAALATLGIEVPERM